MKKIFLFFCITMVLFTLCSCDDLRLDNKKNIVWKSDVFDITATTNQLQEYPSQDGENDYSTIVINEEVYSCFAGFSWQSGYMSIILFDKNTNLEISFYGDKIDGQYQPFIEGHYKKITKDKGKKYNYSILVNLIKSGQYYDYCMDYNLEFPTVINFYGYKDV